MITDMRKHGHYQVGVYRGIEWKASRLPTGHWYGFLSKIGTITEKKYEYMQKFSHNCKFTIPMGFDCAQAGDYPSSLEDSLKLHPTIPTYKDRNYVVRVLYDIIDAYFEFDKPSFKMDNNDSSVYPEIMFYDMWSPSPMGVSLINHINTMISKRSKSIV